MDDVGLRSQEDRRRGDARYHEELDISRRIRECSSLAVRLRLDPLKEDHGHEERLHRSARRQRGESLSDLTERRRAEKALEELRRERDLILRSAGEGIYGLERQGLTTFVKPAAAGMLGWETDQLLGKS